MAVTLVEMLSICVIWTFSWTLLWFCDQRNYYYFIFLFLMQIIRLLLLKWSNVQ